MVFISRIISPPSIDIAEQEIDQVMENINFFDELKEQLFPDISEIGKLIDEILTQEEIEKQVPNSS